MQFSFDPAVIIWLVVAETLYVRAVGRLSGRGFRVPRYQIVLWHLGICCWIVGLISPIDPLGDDLLSAHMAEHLLIADLAAPLFLAGIRTPVLQFLLPRSVLIPLASLRRPRAILGRIRQPLFAVPIYVMVLYGWHFGFMFETAVKHDIVHGLQHASFVAIGMLVWWPAIEPGKRHLGGGLWKIAHIFAARMAGMFLGMTFVFARTPLYTAVYASNNRGHGLSAIADQQIAGALMIIVDISLMVFALAFFFHRAALIEDPDYPGPISVKPPSEQKLKTHNGDVRDGALTESG